LGKGEFMHRRSGDEHIDQADPCDYAKSDEPALEPPPTPPFFLQILDVLLGAGIRYTPLIFLLRTVFLFDEHFMPAVGTDSLFAVRRQFHSPSAGGTD